MQQDVSSATAVFSDWTRLLALDSNSPSGLVFKVQSGKARAGSPACMVIRDGYYTGSVAHRHTKAHRVVFYLTHGYLPEEVDHIDGDRLNNAASNLRSACKSTNMHNRVARGTHRLASGRYAARISLDGRSKHLGVFDSEPAAHAAYLAAKRELHTTAPERCYV